MFRITSGPWEKPLKPLKGMVMPGGDAGRPGALTALCGGCGAMCLLGNVSAATAGTGMGEGGSRSRSVLLGSSICSQKFPSVSIPFSSNSLLGTVWAH